MGNESSPVEITCQVNISTNTGRIPAIALVIPELNEFKEIKHPLSDDNLYQEIHHIAPNASDNPMRYTYQISPKITMNGTMIRCGVGFFRGNKGSCFGEHVILVHYVNSSIPPQPCTPNNIMSSADESEGILSTSTNGVITAGAVSGFVFFIGEAVALFFGVFWWKSHSHRTIAIAPLNNIKEHEN